MPDGVHMVLYVVDTSQGVLSISEISVELMSRSR